MSINFFLALIALFFVILSAADLESEGLKAFQNRDFRNAEKYFLQLTQQAQKNARAWKLLGMTYAAEEKYNLAEPAFNKSCTLNSKEENACYYLARTNYTLGRPERALQFYRLALPEAAATRGRVLLGMALAYEVSSQPGAAEQHYRQAIQAGEARARVDYGLFLFKSGRGAESLPMLEQAGAVAELDRVRRALAGTPQSAARTGLGSAVKFESRPLDMIVRTGATGSKHLIETMIAGVAVFDFDNDGWPDIFIANGATSPGLVKKDPSYSNRLFHNNRDRSFSDVTAIAGVGGSSYSMGVAAADFDNDGNVDLFVAGVHGGILYRNRGNGVFEDVTAKAGLIQNGKWSVAAGWFDYDNDGLLDLFVVHYVVWDPAAEIYCGVRPDAAAHVEGFRQYCHPSNYQPTANALYKNLGNGKFRDVSLESGIAKKAGKGMGVAFGDFDGDGRLDIFVANDTVPSFLFHNEGNGTFQEVGFEAGVAAGSDGKFISAMGADFRDYDNDGKDDLVITALSNETFPLYRNQGNGQFADLTWPSGIGKASLPWTGWGVGMFDFNNDGWKDIFVAGGHVMDNAERSSGQKSAQPNMVFLQTGAAHFEVSQLEGEALHRGVAFGDFDRDGRIDAVVTRLNQPPIVLRNTSQAGNWIAFRLVGHRSNRDGIGASLHLTSASGEQWNRVTTSVGYGGSSDRVVHFGIGKDTEVLQLEIRWPSGIVQKLSGLPVNRFQTIEEPN